MKKTKNFSFSDFVSFSESLVDSLDAVSTKIEEVTNQITTLETVLEGGDAPVEEPVAAEENVVTDEVAPEASEESTVDTEVSTENTDAEEPAVEENVEVTTVPEGTEEVASEETPAEDAPVSEEANDAAAIDAMSTEDENFSDNFIVVGLKNRPWGNKVISSKEFSETEHRKLIPTTFSTKAQAQRALTAYNVNGENFSIKVQHNSNIVNMSEKESRYNTVKSIFNMQ